MRWPQRVGIVDRYSVYQMTIMVICTVLIEEATNQSITFLKNLARMVQNSMKKNDIVFIKTELVIKIFTLIVVGIKGYGFGIYFGEPRKN